MVEKGVAKEIRQTVTGHKSSGFNDTESKYYNMTSDPQAMIVLAGGEMSDVGSFSVAHHLRYEESEEKRKARRVLVDLATNGDISKWDTKISEIEKRCKTGADEANERSQQLRSTFNCIEECVWCVLRNGASSPRDASGSIVLKEDGITPQDPIYKIHTVNPLYQLPVFLTPQFKDLVRIVSEAQKEELKGPAPLSEEQKKLIGDALSNLNTTILHSIKAYDAKIQKLTELLACFVQSNRGGGDLNGTNVFTSSGTNLFSSSGPNLFSISEKPKITLSKRLPKRKAGAFENSVCFGVAHEYYCGTNPIFDALQRGREMGQRNLAQKRKRAEHENCGEREGLKFTFTNYQSKGFKDRKLKRKKIASAVKAKLQAGEDASDERSLEVAAIALETELDQYISNLPAKNKKKRKGVLFDGNDYEKFKKCI